MKNIRFSLLLFVVSFLLILAACGDQTSTGGNDKSDYPKKPVTFMLPYDAGGPTDLFFREFSRIAEKHLGKKIVIKNETGGGGLTMYSALANAKPDGYTMAAGMGTTLYSINPHIDLIDNDPDDFTLISSIFEYQFVVAASSDAPFENFEEMIEYSKKNNLKIASTSLTTSIFSELINQEEDFDLKWTRVDYDGGGEALAAVLGNHADLIIDAPSAMLGSEEAGDIKILAVLPESKIAAFPDAPTLNEFYESLSLSAMIGLGGPSGLEEDVIQTWEEVIEKTLEDPDLIEFAEKNSYTIVAKSQEEVQEYFDKQREQFGEVIDRVVD